MGSEGAKALLEMITNSAHELQPQIVMEPELIVRESTGRVSQRAMSDGKKPRRTGAA
jgi:DNA-binding LacI/PurR family transcriptional regulator